MKDLPILEGMRVTLRPFAASDAYAYSRWLEDDWLRSQVGESRMCLEEVIRKQEIWTMDADTAEYIIVDTASNQPIGDISLYGASQEAERPTIGIMIGEPSMRGNGCGEEALGLIVGYARQRSIPKVYAEVFPENDSSRNFFRKMGFAEQGMVIDEKDRQCVSYVLDCSYRTHG